MSLCENIERAVELGFMSLGISDHSPTPMWGSDFFTGNEKEYTAEIKKVADKYSDNIDVFAGLELDSFFDFHREYYDYILASVHFIKVGGECPPVDWSGDVQRETIMKYFGGREIDYVKTYFSDFVSHVENCRPDIVGHFDLFTKFGVINTDSDEYRKAAREAVSEIIKICPRFEINTGAIFRGYKSSVYPDPFILEEICRLGGKVVINSDCHDGFNLNGAFDSAVSFAKDAGFTHVDRLTNNGFVSDELD
ncbi:MAG: hypothetical protein IKM46_00540 [Clostridia bacterium]|nr:hypothetical protein [Clostridia bacterium]